MGVIIVARVALLLLINMVWMERFELALSFCYFRSNMQSFAFVR